MKRSTHPPQDTWTERTEQADRGTAWSAPMDRRSAMKLMGAAIAMGTASCSPPEEEILPYIDMPEGLVPGKPLKFATAHALLGPAFPVVATTYEGRPTKLDGNPDHPWSKGASDTFTQAAVLSLYDPDRARAPTKRGEVHSWKAFADALAKAMAGMQDSDGEGLRVLSGAVTSPTLARQMQFLRRQFPKARWHRWQPVNEYNAHAGARLAFGRPVQTLYRFDRARVICSLGADPLGPGPNQVRYAADFAEGRRARKGTRALTRLYAAEPNLSLTGTQADRRLALPSARIGELGAALAAQIAGEELETDGQDASMRQFLQDLSSDLSDNAGAAVVVVGESQPPEIHVLGHWLNQQLGAFGKTVTFAQPAETEPTDQAGSIAELVAGISAGRVKILLILGGNPAYDAPADLDFAGALENVPFTARLGLYEDETSARCLWHLPESHPLEIWSDARAPNGMATIIQPLITPLFDTRSVHEVLELLATDAEASGYELVKATWRSAHEEKFDGWWRQALRTGRASGPQLIEADTLHVAERPSLSGRQNGPTGFELNLLPDAAVWDGRFANNAWLQETPRPCSKIVWGNALQISPDDARRLEIGNGDQVELTDAGRRIFVPAFVAAGQAPGTLSLALGYGRTRAGAIGTAIGVDAYPMRRSDALWTVQAVEVRKTGGHIPLATTQEHHSMEGRDIVRKYDIAALAALSSEREARPSLYPEYAYDSYAWAMVVDQSVCIGCNACVSACQAENNVPVVGPDEIRRGRDMHWLRIDHYLGEGPESPDVFFQPVACMHCENAPCEPVCPVEASVHDSEGLNVQVYNRCIGTRFCQSNCPYKVRRFNFFGYGNGQEYANLGEPLYDAVSQPDVTVRARGVMEKCTYCLQRISRARRQAKEEGRRIRDGEVVTACQEACPTTAIHFGDQSRKNSTVARLQREPHAYELLGHLGTRPRTSYLAVVRDSGTPGTPES